MLSKLRQYVLHFLISCLIMLGIAGLIKYQNDVRNLNEQIYLASKSHGTLVISKPVEKSLIDKILDKKKLPVSPDIPKKDISSVVEIHTSTNCPPVDITILKSGTVVSDSPGVTKIIVENYDNQILGGKLNLRIASMLFPRQQGHPLSWDIGLQISYFRVWRIHPDLTLSRNFAGLGLSYNPDIAYLENLYFGAGYGYHFTHNYKTPYVGGSLRFGK